MAEFSKTVYVANPRVTMATYSLGLFFLGLAVLIFGLYKPYQSERNVVTLTSMTVVAPRSPGSVSALALDATVQEMPICEEGQHGSTCMPAPLRYEQLHSASAFVTTSVRRTPLGNPSAPQQSTPQTNTTAVVPSADELTIKFSFEWGLSSSLPLNIPEAADGLRGRAQRGVATLLLNHKAEPISIRHPDQSIDFSLVELAELVGLSPSSTDWRILGVDVGVGVDCYGEKALLKGIVHDTSLLSGLDARSEVCVMRFGSFSRQSTRRYVENSGAGSVLVEVSGVHVRCVQGGGTARVWNSWRLLSFIIGMLVVRSLPHRIMRRIMLWNLGQMSVLYRQCLVEVFDDRGACITAAARSMTRASAYVELADLVENVGLVISKARMKERLFSTWPTSKSEMDLDTMVHLAFRSADNLRVSRPGQREVLRDMYNEVFDRAPRQDACQHMDLLSYCKVMSVGDQVLYEDVAELFDTQRRKGLAEKLFTPRALQRVMQLGSKFKTQASISRAGTALVSTGPRELLEDLGPWNSDLWMDDRKSCVDKTETADSKQSVQLVPASVALSAMTLEQKKQRTIDVVEQMPTALSQIYSKQKKIDGEIGRLGVEVRRLVRSVKITHERTIDLEKTTSGSPTGESPTICSPTAAFGMNLPNPLERVESELREMQDRVSATLDELRAAVALELEAIQGLASELREERISCDDAHSAVQDALRTAEEVHKKLDHLSGTKNVSGDRKVCWEDEVANSNSEAITAQDEDRPDLDVPVAEGSPLSGLPGASSGTSYCALRGWRHSLRPKPRRLSI